MFLVLLSQTMEKYFVQNKNPDESGGHSKNLQVLVLKFGLKLFSRNLSEV